MKKILILLFSAIVSLGANAQQKNNTPKPQGASKHHKITPEERAQRKAELLSQQLQLNAGQTSKIKAAMIERNNALRTIREKVNGNDEAFRNEALPIRKKFHNDLKKILTEDQFKKFKEFRKANQRNNGATQKEGDDLIDESELDQTK
jgi:hypothetical protein